MAFCHLSSIHNLCTSIPFPKFGPSPLKLRSHQTLARRNFVLACSAEKSSKKGKLSRARKNDEEIRNELLEFMSVMGLSEDHVPSTKELLEHGRRDLANIVRRRGYKAIMELLRHSSVKGIDREKNSHGNQDISSACSDEVSEDQERNLNNSGGCFSTSDSSMEENYIVKANGSACNSVWICEPSESSLRSLQLEATSFTHTGVMEIIEDDSEESTDMPADFEVNPNILNSNNADMASMDPRQAPFSSMEYQLDSNGTASGEVLDSADFDVDVASDMDAENDNQIEIDRLKSILHKKKKELSLLMQQVEKEKQALSDLQAKANVEIVNARRVLSAKDVELHAAEESLLGLKEVQIEYWADCESVEVAGSFNGWHHRVKLDLHPSSYTINPPESRKSKLWSTTLWLYPGLYEIKFIVDGHWRTDSQREIITNGSITNNILRVDR